MQLERLDCKNFSSFKEVSITFPLVTTMIKGINKDSKTAVSNGAGKSSIYDAILWCLYGKTSKQNKIKDVIKQGEKETEVTVFLLKNKDKYRITRKISNSISSINIFKNDEDISASSIADNEIKIQSVVNLSYKTFLLSTYFGVETVRKFGQATDSEKKEVLDELLSLDFNVYKNYILSKLNEIDLKIVNLNGEISKNNALIESLKSNEKELKEIKVEEIETSELRKLEIEKENLVNRKKEIEKLCSELSEKLKRLTPVFYQMNYLKKTISFFKDNEKCPSCSQPINPDYKKDITEPLLKELFELSEEEKELKKLSVIFENLKVKEAVIANNLTDYDQRLYLLRDKKKEQEKLSLHLDEKIEKIHLNIFKLSSSLDKLNKQKLELEESKSIYNFWKEGFGNKGIKLLIQSEIIEILNLQLNNYINYLFNDSLTCKLELTDKVTILIKNKKGELSYYNLSGGERRRVDIAILMALRDVFVQKNKMAFVFYDEALDIIDKIGQEKILDLLLQKEEEASLIITHNEKLLDIYNKYVLTVTKENDSSNISFTKGD